jgi:alanine dehydrogenase
MVKDGGFSNSLRNHAWIRKGTYLFNGNLTNKSLADKFQLKYRDLDLLVGLFN